MKTLTAVIVMALAAALPAAGQVASFGVNVSFGTFYSGLSAYGEWVWVDQDVYAWRPTAVAAGWRPYSYGRWAWTDDGWYWVSEEPWAWAAYHYGRWYYDDYYGWMWIPGYHWAPAWVEWRYGGDCVGWAPLGPYALFSFNYGVYYSRPWHTPYSYWSFVPYGYMTSDHCRSHIYRNEYNRRYVGLTRAGGSVAYEGGRIVTRGVDRAAVERRTGRRIERSDLVDARNRGENRVTRSGDREQIQVYRPNLEGQPGRSAQVRPDRFRSGERTVTLDTRNIEGRVRREPQGRNAEEAEQSLRQNGPGRAPEVQRTLPSDRLSRPSPELQRVPERGRSSLPRERLDAQRNRSGEAVQPFGGRSALPGQDVRPDVRIREREAAPGAGRLRSERPTVESPSRIVTPRAGSTPREGSGNRGGNSRESRRR